MAQQAGTQHKIGKILVALKYATVDQVKQALEFQKEKPGTKVGRILVTMGYCTDVHIARALAKQRGVPFLDPANLGKISPDVLTLATPEQVREHRVIPVMRKGAKLTVASPDALEFFSLDNLRFIFGGEVSYCIAPESALAEVAKAVYGIEDFTVTGEGAAAPALADIVQKNEEDEEGVVAQLVQTIISDAIRSGASDIHVEPMKEKLRIRYRIDGDCREMECPPKRLQGSVISRIKILAGMKIQEKRVPQDGRIKTRIENRDVDLRVSCLPCFYGESVVMRILDKAEGLASLDGLGMHATDLERFNRMISRPTGIFLVTGPTGSGKTTTLYTALNALNRPDIKLITAEDPIEYNLAGINQCQVREEIGLTFGKILRAMLRQAPNIILVGEIRDEETASMAIEASLTGHLVFSTLHTNDAPSSLTRLINMGAKPLLVASAIQGILAQRLIRRLCPHCKRPYTPTEQELATVDFKPEQIAGKTIYEAVGCSKCNHTGYKGRMAVFELLEMNVAMRELVFENSDSMRLRQAAIENGMTTLQIDGMRKVLSGQSTIDEVLTVTHRGDLV